MSITPTERTFLRKKLTYDSNGRLQSNGHFFIEDLSYLLSSTSPLQKRPAFFWKAQCLFRGLPTVGTPDDIINILRLEGHRRMIPDLVDMEEEMRTDYERRKLLATQEAEVVAREWADGEKAESEPQKSPREELPITLGEQVDEKGQELHNTRDMVLQSIEEDREKAHSDLLGAPKSRDWDVTDFPSLACLDLSKKGNEDSTKGKENEEQNTDIDDKERCKDEFPLFTSTSELFFLPDETKPSDENSTSKMASRVETGIFIGLTFSQFFYLITFGEPNGTTLKGSFGDLSSKDSSGDLESRKEDCEFTGTKVGMGSTSPLGITSIWENKSAAAQEVMELLRLWAAAE
ncbi:hypothetical protein EYC84_000791 [Monilinia fructicola]|uniref:Uncharacterized protein n=1 Tax=Monilinia fructicola TaxID=38448 RepID=A0A5M9JIK8_MONFR|nr:hypothetical protein EYC84_000791 [Monilinia fructicola]